MQPESQKKNYFHTGGSGSRQSQHFGGRAEGKGIQGQPGSHDLPHPLKPNYLILHIRKPIQILHCLGSRKIDGLVDKLLSVVQKLIVY